MAHLSLSLLGALQVSLNGEPAAGFESNKVRALLVYLAVEADRPHRRDSLAGLLWSEYPDRAALNNLRYGLSNLRKAIDDRASIPPFLHISSESLQFNTASSYDLDVRAFVEGIESGELERLKQAVALYRGAFLEGFAVADSEAFEDWVFTMRERLSRLMPPANCSPRSMNASPKASTHPTCKKRVCCWNNLAYREQRRFDQFAEGRPVLENS